MIFDKELVEKAFDFIFKDIFLQGHTFRSSQEAFFIKECFETWILNCDKSYSHPEDIRQTKNVRKASFTLLKYFSENRELEMLEQIKTYWKQTEDINKALEMFLR